MKTDRPNLTREKCRICMLDELDKNIDRAVSAGSKIHWSKIKMLQLDRLRSYCRKPINSKSLHLCSEAHIAKWKELRIQLSLDSIDREKELKERLNDAITALQNAQMKRSLLVMRGDLQGLDRLQFAENRLNVIVAQRRRRLKEFLNKKVS